MRQVSTTWKNECGTPGQTQCDVVPLAFHLW